ncbi:MAG TPA: DNA-processing protein DprA [Spirochaetota bacterium]
MNTRYYLALERAHGIGTATLSEIYETVRSIGISISDLFGCTDAELRNEFVFSEAIYKGFIEAKESLDDVDEEYGKLVAAGICATFFFDKNYPSLLKDKLHNGAPAVLYSIGDLSIAQSRAAALLSGSETSEKGTRIIHQTAIECARHHITVIGGLSKGAGSAAQAAALENGGQTIGILPCGFFTFELSARLTALYDPKKFLLLSPFRPDEEFSPFHAMSRNRNIIALSRALFIVETPKDGGLMEAAKSAAKLSVPLYTAQYADYPAGASGNEELIKNFNAIPVRGRREGDMIIPNIEALIASVKFGDA